MNKSTDYNHKEITVDGMLALTTDYIVSGDIKSDSMDWISHLYRRNI